MEGTIKSITADKGFGFIKTAAGDEYFFHRSALKNTRFEDLKKGQEVTFEDVDSAKGLRAEDIFV